MAKLPEHEERMIDFIDWNLSCELLVWLEKKSGRSTPIILLHEKLLECCTQYIEKIGGISDDYFLAEPRHLVKDLISYLNVKKHGNSYEINAIEKHLHNDYGKHFLPIIRLLESESITSLVNNISHNVQATWSSIIEQHELPMDGFSIYLNWLRKNYIKDANFKPKKKPNLFDDEMWNLWMECRDDEYVLDKHIPSDEKKKIVEEWNSISKKNYGLSGVIEGFLYDTDYVNVKLDGQYGHDAYVIYIPKEINEKKFDSLIRDIKTRIFHRRKPINTIRDYLTWYLPTSLRDDVYTRQLVTQKNQIIAYYAALLCDVFYTNRNIPNIGKILPIKVTSLLDAAELSCSYLSDFGFSYSPETIIKNHNKLFNKIMPTFKLNFE
ncbi:hypothetical protein [Aeromonas salmonicida]|uniref:hypothetical protein n=1 Tax=Aeromonas salmonicida TaxID=645 RepID=UPI0038D3E5D3